MIDDGPPRPPGVGRRAVLRVLVLGANGPTGRRTVQRALESGLRVDALTRHPEAFPITHERLRVIEGDATRAEVVDPAVAACDAVISVIGSRYTRSPVDVYSASGRLVVEAMARHGLRRLIVVTSSSVSPQSARQGRLLVDRVALPLLRHVIGRTVYDDMDRLEALVRASGLDWTIVRPPGLSDEPAVRDRITAETHVPGMLCARDDLAAFLVDQLDDVRFVGRVAAIASPGLHVDAARLIRQEVLKR